jgi:hypothetical protein
MNTKIALYALIAFMLLSSTFGCGRVSKSAARRVLRGEARAAERQSASVLRRDLLRDRATASRALASERSTFRYTTKAQAKRELRGGIRQGSHLTSRAYPGRPLKAASAQARYGLPRRPEVRMTVDLPKGTEVRTNRALGGAPGVGEVTTVRRTNPSAIRKVVPLPR